MESFVLSWTRAKLWTGLDYRSSHSTEVLKRGNITVCVPLPIPHEQICLFGTGTSKKIKKKEDKSKTS